MRPPLHMPEPAMMIAGPSRSLILAAWFAAVPRRGAATAIVTHGEDEARASYAALLGDRFGAPTIVPALDQTIALP